MEKTQVPVKKNNASVELLRFLAASIIVLCHWEQLSGVEAQGFTFAVIPNNKTKLIEQFDGFFSMEDITPPELRKRLINSDEYWGWPNGIAVETQVLKQADVLQLFALLDIFKQDVIKANYEYYEPRTEHGSSLSPSIHSLIAAKAGLKAEAYRYFQEASTIDIYNMSKKANSGGEFLGGIHTAANGGVWLMLVRGFAGFEFRNETVFLKPMLPSEWESLTFKILILGNLLSIMITQNKLVIEAAQNNTSAATICVGEELFSIDPGMRLEHF